MGCFAVWRARAECDLVAAYTSRIPIAVIAEMMAMPPEETPYLQEVAETTTRLIGSAAASWRDFRSANDVIRGFDRYLGEHVERLREDDAGDSILSDVIHSGDLTEIEIRMLAGLLLGAGFVTTSHVLGKAVVALVRHPDQLAALCANPEGWPNAIEEILRYDTAGQLSRGSPPKTLTSKDFRIEQANRCFFWWAGPTATRQSSNTQIPST